MIWVDVMCVFANRDFEIEIFNYMEILQECGNFRH